MGEVDRLRSGPPTDVDPGLVVVVEASAPDPGPLLERFRLALRWAAGDEVAEPLDQLLPGWATKSTPRDPSWAPWLSADQRPWRYWEGSVAGPETVRLVVMVPEWPTSLETLTAALRAVGATEVVVRY